MKKALPLALAAACLAGGASAQFYVPSGQPIPNVTSVTNEGVAVGYDDQNCPFYIWDAVNDTQKFIGGISAGQGVGGVPRFSGDGKLIAAPMQSDKINIFTEWSTATFDYMAPFTFHQYCYVGDYNLLAVGSSLDGKEGIIVKSSNAGGKWQRADALSRQKEDGTWENYTPDFPIYCIAPTIGSKGIILVGGGNGTLLSGSGNGYWNKASLPEIKLPSPIEAFRDMSFTYLEVQNGYKDAAQGCMLVELQDGSYAVIYTLDGTETFAVSENIADKPVALANNGNDFFLATSEGLIQVSKDYGKTWETVLTEDNGRPFYRIVFADENKGVALSDNVVYITRDGGKTWEETVVIQNPAIGFPKTSSWKDAVWLDDYLVMVGTNACCYRSTDDGKTFTELKGFAGDLATVFYDARKITSVIGQEGMTWRKEDKEFISGYTAGLYDVEADTWTPLTSTGYVQGETASSPWQISGDGRHVVGIAHGLNSASTITSCAAIWDGVDNVKLLPNRFVDGGTFDEPGDTRACRANAVSYDGSVVAGWQDVWGPWFGSVWRKGADGTYTQTILTAKDKTADDIDWTNRDEMAANLVGACQTVSDNGKWIGGRGTPGQNAVSGAWIWSEETGFTVLCDDMDSTVADVNNDGTLAIGWEGPGSGAWIWSEKEGFSYLSDYVEKKLGHAPREFVIASVYDLSPNGRYVCGYGMLDGNPVGYVFDLLTSSGADEMEAAQVNASVYPNPVVSELHVDLPFDNSEVQTSINLYNVQGGVVRSIGNCRQSNVINVEGLGAGIYVLDVRTGNTHKTFKVVVK